MRLNIPTSGSGEAVSPSRPWRREISRRISPSTRGKSGSENPVILLRRVLARLAEQVAEEVHRPGLAQGFVPVAALGGLDAGGATPFARAAGDDADGVPGEGGEGVEAASGDADATGVAVVH